MSPVEVWFDAAKRNYIQHKHPKLNKHVSKYKRIMFWYGHCTKWFQDVSDRSSNATWPHGTSGNIMFLSTSGLFNWICHSNLDLHPPPPLLRFLFPLLNNSFGWHSIFWTNMQLVYFLYNHSAHLIIWRVYVNLEWNVVIRKRHDSVCSHDCIHFFKHICTWIIPLKHGFACQLC